MSTRYAVVGAGMMGCEHIRNIALLDGAQIGAVVDPDAGSLAQSGDLASQYFEGVARHSRIDQVLKADNIDAFIIASPNYTHFDVARTLMQTGKPLLIEKPMCTAEPDALSLHELASVHPALIWIGLEYRYMPPVTRFIEYAHSGRAGTIKMLTIREHRFPFLRKVGDWNRFNENTGGTLVEKCCHFFDLMRHILQDDPVRVFASGAQDVNHLKETYDGCTPDILDNAYVMLDFAGGARAVLDLCMFAEGSPEQEEIYALGPLGKLEVKIPSGVVGWYPRDRKGTSEEHVPVPDHAMAAGTHHGATYYQLSHFHQRVREGGSADVTTLDGLRSVQIGLAAQHSIATGRPVDLRFDVTG